MRQQSLPASSAAHPGQAKRFLARRFAAAEAAWEGVGGSDTWWFGGAVQQMSQFRSNCAMCGVGVEASTSNDVMVLAWYDFQCRTYAAWNNWLLLQRRCRGEARVRKRSDSVEARSVGLCAARPARTDSKIDLYGNGSRCKKKQIMKSRVSETRTWEHSEALLRSSASHRVGVSAENTNLEWH